MHKPESILENVMHRIFCDFEIQTDHLIPARKLDLVIVYKNQTTNQTTNQPNKKPNKTSENQRKRKERQVLTLASELKKLWNMRVMVVAIGIDALVTIPKGLVKRLEDLEIRWQLEIIKTTALLRSARILRRVLETRGDLLSFKLQWKAIS